MNFKNTSVRRDWKEAGEQDHSSQARAAPPTWRGFVQPRDPGAGSGLGALRHRAGELAEEAGKPPPPQARESASS